MGVKARGFLLVMLLSGCSQVTQPVANPAATSPSGSPTTPAATVGMSCRLPISTPEGQGAFISFPTGAVSFDPLARGLQGDVYYDRAFSSWLPVSRQAVSPDGTHYAYLDSKVPGTPGQARLHVVDVPSRNERVIDLGPTGDPSGYMIVNFATEGIWLSYTGYEGPGGGLLLLDLSTGALKNPGVPGMVESSGGSFGRDGETLMEPVAGGPGVFWFTDGGPNPQSAAIGFTIPARVQRLTMSDGKTSSWFTKQEAWVRVLGADVAGHPIIATWPLSADMNSKTIWLASSPTKAQIIGLPQGDYRFIADGHGVWFGNQQGIFLYSDATGLQKVSNQPGYPANGCF